MTVLISMDKVILSSNAHTKPLSNDSVSLTSDRVRKLLGDDQNLATSTSFRSKIASLLHAQTDDLFKPEFKQKVFQSLYDMIHKPDEAKQSPTETFHRFSLLSAMAHRNNHALFTVQTEPTTERDNKGQLLYTVRYLVAEEAIKQEKVDEVTRDAINACLGCTNEEHFGHTLTKPATTINHYKVVPDPKERDRLTDQSFTLGGVNKKVNPATGTLRADTQVGREDFIRENALAHYASNKPDLNYYISTQRTIEPPKGVDPSYTYAEFDVFDKSQVISQELLGAIHDLSRHEAQNVALQLLEISKVMYNNQVAHRDLHMNNLLLHKVKDTGEIFLKVIDFGRLKYDQQFEPYQLNDIKYLFNRQGESLGETFVRNYVVSDRSDIAKKHYPLHKLIDEFEQHDAMINDVLSQAGKKLEADLTSAKQDHGMIDVAFMQAKRAVIQLFNQVHQLDHNCSNRVTYA
ncbi:hypothetical protein ACODM8_21120 [Vibrio ostreicida]|uniref:hypothetical protein n=1 Tax=Vibrio ostreicida TaxID=526588 RepID=UPI001180B231|nr:hypothetical protein [Vibrio ostreicida]